MKLALAFALLPALASADPIIVKPANESIVWTGNAGVVNWQDAREPLTWTSIIHLRFACFEQLGADDSPTDDRARSASCVRQTIRDGLFVYTMDVSALQCGDRAQGDSELDAGSDVGLWLVVPRDCGEAPPRAHDEPSPVPEPSVWQLLALGLALAWRFIKRR